MENHHPTQFKFEVHPTTVKHTFVAGLILLMLMGISLYLAQKHNHQQVIQALDQQATEQVNLIHDSIERYEYILRGLRGAIIAHGNDRFDQEDLSKYVESRDMLTEFPAARGIGIIRRVQQDQVNNFVESMRLGDSPDFTLKQITNNAGERAIIQYVLPLKGNAQAIGLDISSEKNRNWAVQRSKNTGNATLSGPITLVQATGEGNQAFLLMLPIYKGHQHITSTEERIQKCYAWVYSPILMSDLFKSTARGDTLIKVQIVDITEQPTAFYNSKPELILEAGLPVTTKTQKVFGRSWQFFFTATPAFIKAQSPIHIPTFILIEALFSVLALFITYLISVYYQRKKIFQQQQMHLAAIVQSSNDAIISKDLNGVVQTWNKGAERLFEYQEDEAVERLLADLIIPEHLLSEEVFILQTIREGKSIENLISQRQTKSGKKLDVSIMVSPIYDDSGVIVGSSKTIRDITQQKSLEMQLKRLNSEMEKKAITAELNFERTNKLLQDVLDASVEVAIMATDSDGMVVLFNTGAELMLGFKSDEVLGTLNLIDFIPQEYIRKRAREIELNHQEIIEGFDALCFIPKTSGSETVELEYKTKSGQKFYVSQSISPIRDKARKITGYVVTAINIDEQKAAEL